MLVNAQWSIDIFLAKQYKCTKKYNIMLDNKTCIEFYSRIEIQNEILKFCKDKEIGTRYLEGFFGKRPDIILTKNDILTLAKSGVSSFHVSEERWENPMQLAISKNKKDLDSLRTGWDLIIDIDCPNWELSKRICSVIIDILKKHDIKSISCKFSGNKGFHIGVPFEAFPQKIQGDDARLFFPDGVKRILEYIAFYAKKNYSDKIIKGFNTNKLAQELGIEKSKLIREFCKNCNTNIENNKHKITYSCSKCGNIMEKEEYQETIECPKCGFGLMQPDKKERLGCPNCNSTEFEKEINFNHILGLDEVLISSRHLYRMPFSLHEKSGLVSVPIDIEKVDEFKKELAKPANVTLQYSFLDTSKTKNSEAEKLIINSLDFNPKIINMERKEIEEKFNSDKEMLKVIQNFDNDEKLPIECFPPSIINLLKGLKDGKKRALFILLNFLDCVGWENNEIEDIVVDWNKKNTPPLKEGIIKTHLNYKKNSKEKILPPNYSNQKYYADLGILSPEEKSGKLKNPVNYAFKKSFFSKNKKNKK